ncbi:hypothetical protein [Lewinella sp. JB7]|nr:hypothetical protein [Lewinella sp. JB7]MCP9235981.1 hypothetical protein [Lewinella sp. JB7]
MKQPAAPPTADADTEKPPILGHWRNIYAVVLLLHLLLIISFYLVTRIYS